MKRAKSTRATRTTAGFTLVELMIALVISGIVIGTMYSVGSASSRHFQMQHQVANMQSALRFAMVQLKRDLMRAGYQSTPLSSLDECTPVGISNNIMFGGDGWIAGISSFRNDIVPNLVDPTGNNAANGFTHDEVTLLGNFATSNEYPGITAINSGQIRLDINPLTTWHSLQQDFGWADNGSSSPGTATQIINAGLVRQVFPSGSLIRIQTASGRRHYAVLTTDGAVAGNFITLTFAPNLTNACLAEVNGGWVAPLQFIRYGVTQTAAANISDRAMGAIPQLVRTQQVPNNKNMAVNGTIPRTVLDYVASFNLSFTMTQQTGPGNPDNYPIGASLNNTNNQVTVNQNPELVRAVSVTLAVRAPSTDPGMRFYNCQNLACFQISPGSTGAPAARVRTLRAEIFLPNIAYEGWR